MKQQQKTPQNSNNRKGTFLGCAIWMSSGFISIILMSILTGIHTGTTGSGIPYLIYFLLPALVITTANHIHEGLDGIKLVRNLFSRKSSKQSIDQEAVNKKYRKIVISVAFVFYGLLGYIMGLFYPEKATKLLAITLAIGISWGYIVSLLFEKGHLVRDNSL